MTDTDNEFNPRTTKYWGEIPDPENICEQNGHLSPNVSEDIRRSMQKDCLDRYPDDGNMMEIQEIKTYRPLSVDFINLKDGIPINQVKDFHHLVVIWSYNEFVDNPPGKARKILKLFPQKRNFHGQTEETVSRFSLLPPPDPLVVHAIHLHNWMRDMTETISVAELAAEKHIISPEDAINPIPEMPTLELKHKPNTLNFIPPKPIEELRESIQNTEIPELSQWVVKQILAKSIALLTAQIGFEESNQSAVDTLVDVLNDFYTKICDRVVSALEEEETLDTGGFPNVIERVLVEKGMGGAKGIHEYYQSRVVNYIRVLRNRCKGLEQHYSSMLIPEPEQVTE